MSRMRVVHLFAALYFGSIVGALAADMPLKAPPVPPPSWAGPYVGVTAGVDWGTFDPRTWTSAVPGGEFAPSSLAAFNAGGVETIKSNGFTGGLEAGYNWQHSNWVYGLEGDIESFHLGGSATTGPTVYPCCAPATFTVSSSAHTDWLATLRARVGLASDRWLIYATGGAALTTINGSFSFSETFYGTTESASLSNSKLGYTVGGGVETKAWNHWSVKAEYLYVDFGPVSTSGILGAGVLIPTQPFTHDIDLRANIVRLGLNYHF